MCVKFKGLKRAAQTSAGAGLAPALMGLAAWAAGAGQAGAIPAPKIGQPVDGAIDLQGGATVVSANIHEFHTILLWIITIVTAVVLLLLLWVMIRYNRRANPTPRKFSHNTLVEIVWTVVPVLILVFIAVKSFPLLAEEEIPPKTELTIKAIGNKWYWSYEYPDMGVSFDSNVLAQKDAAARAKPYLLAVDEPLIVPTGINVKVLISSNDVIHSWAMPSFGVKQDAIPGRVNVAWFNVKDPGVYYGQCSELCGIRHAFMPIEIHAVNPVEFEAWIRSKGGSTVASAPTAPAEPAPSAPAAPAAAPAGQPS
ncbi:MAG: cytochrome c oxidase subunit II [Hyphomonadaceae bacterium]